MTRIGAIVQPKYSNLMKPRIYLDHAATTPMRPEAMAAVAGGMTRWANPSSPHAEGRAARAALEDARARIKAALGWTGELIFTSGASEALSVALNRAKVDRQVVSAVEHDAVYRAAPAATVAPVRAGLVDAEALVRLARSEGRAIVAVQHVNSETGTCQSPHLFADDVREAGGLLLCDCAQSAGKFALPDADFVVVSAHKLGGPPGIGALLVRDLATLEPMGGHEFGYRQGTENLPGAMGFAAAVEAIDQSRPFGFDGAATDAIFRLRDTVRDHGGSVVDGGAPVSMFITAYAMPSLSAAAQLIRFDAMGFAVSAGSACSSGTLKRSRALEAFGVDEDTASRTIRVSFGWTTTPEEIDAFRVAWLEVAHDAARQA